MVHTLVDRADGTTNFPSDFGTKRTTLRRTNSFAGPTADSASNGSSRSSKHLPTGFLTLGSTYFPTHELPHFDTDLMSNFRPDVGGGVGKNPSAFRIV